MNLEQIHILNFKNISEKTFQFTKKINCFLLENGKEKPICLMLFIIWLSSKSYFNPVALQNIKHLEDFCG